MWYLAGKVMVDALVDAFAADVEAVRAVNNATTILKNKLLLFERVKFEASQQMMRPRSLGSLLRLMPPPDRPRLSTPHKNSLT